MTAAGVRHPVPGGYLSILMYGPRTEWVRNVLSAGTARLSIGGEEMRLVSPRMVRKKDVWPLVPAGTRSPVGVSEESELLRMDLRRED